jgi:hypothetical protein
MTCISKTDYVLWRHCAKNAWLKLHKPDVYYATEMTEFEQSIIDRGIEVEAAACGLFADGVLISGSKTESQQKTTALLISKTRTLFQAVFEKDGLLAVIDVLQFDAETEAYSIYEIKSSTTAQEEHLYDLAFQLVLLRKMGLKVSRAFIIHLNANYIRKGVLDTGQVFVAVDMTSRIDQISAAVTKEVEQAQAYLSAEAEPQGSCSCIYRGRSRHCSTFRYSNPHVPEYGIHDISRIGSSPKRLKELVNAGIFALDDLPPDIKLSQAQKTQLRIYRSGGTVIDKEAIARELDELNFPLHFIDYETCAEGLPQFDLYSPYDHIPLQYSVHIVGSPDEEPIHRDFLYSGNSDPSAAFLDSLQQHLGSFGTIIVWNKAFESQVNDGIAHRSPATRNYIAELNDRMYDLKDIFAKQYFVHRCFCGKVSIKSVLPVLVPQMSYSNLAIQDGASAAVAWSQILFGRLNEKECADLFGKLREYCALDSYGMYAIWRALISLTEG